jgi:hypothetical protein
MKLIIACLLLSVVIIDGFSQGSTTFLSDQVTGNVYRPSNRSDVEGNSLLFSDWVPGIVFLKDGRKTDKFLLNLDVYSQEVLFQHDGNALVVMDQVREVHFNVLREGKYNTLVFRNGYLVADKNLESTFYEVLQDGPVTLLKGTKKIITEKTEYNQPVVKAFETIETYYLVKNGTAPEKFSRSRKGLVGAIGDENGRLMNWVEKQGLKCKNDEEMKAVVKAFNDGLIN